MKPHSFPDRRPDHGFTLIELLVVIAIIAILTAILFPVFAQVRDKACAAACLSNEKQIGLAMLRYTQDYDELYPAGVLTAGTRRGNGWAGQIAPYVKNLQVFTCPSDPTPPSNNRLNPPISYATNAAISFVINGWNEPALAGFNAPAKTIFAFEVKGATFNPSNDATIGGSPSGNGYSGTSNLIPSYNPVQVIYATGYIPNRGTSAMTVYDGASAGSGPFGRHQQGSNYLLCDGHVKLCQPGPVSAGLAAPSSTSPETANTSPYNAAGTDVTTHISSCGGGQIAITFSPI